MIQSTRAISLVLVSAASVLGGYHALKPTPVDYNDQDEWGDATRSTATTRTSGSQYYGPGSRYYGSGYHSMYYSHYYGMGSSGYSHGSSSFGSSGSHSSSHGTTHGGFGSTGHAAHS